MLSMQVPDGQAPRRHGAPQGARRAGRAALLPDQDPKIRELHPPSTAATLNLAATAAQAPGCSSPTTAVRRPLPGRGPQRVGRGQAHPAMYAGRTTTHRRRRLR